jgi:hypothetical protein
MSGRSRATASVKNPQPCVSPGGPRARARLRVGGPLTRLPFDYESEWRLFEPRPASRSGGDPGPTHGGADGEPMADQLSESKTRLLVERAERARRGRQVWEGGARCYQHRAGDTGCRITVGTPCLHSPGGTPCPVALRARRVAVPLRARRLFEPSLMSSALRAVQPSGHSTHCYGLPGISGPSCHEASVPLPCPSQRRQFSPLFFFSLYFGTTPALGLTPQRPPQGGLGRGGLRDPICNPDTPCELHLPP